MCTKGVQPEKNICWFVSFPCPSVQKHMQGTKFSSLARPCTKVLLDLNYVTRLAARQYTKLRSQSTFVQGSIVHFCTLQRIFVLSGYTSADKPTNILCRLFQCKLSWTEYTSKAENSSQRARNVTLFFLLNNPWGRYIHWENGDLPFREGGWNYHVQMLAL